MKKILEKIKRKAEKWNHKKQARYIKAAVFILFALIVYRNADFLSHTNILLNENKLSYPSVLTVGANGNRYIVDTSTTRVVVLDENSRYLYQINGGTTARKGFNFTNNIAVDEAGNVYLTSVESNENDDKDAGYKILKYDNKGNFDRILYETTYDEDEMLYIQSSCMTLEYDGGRLYYAQREYGRIAMYSIATDGSETEPLLELARDYQQAELLVADFAIQPQTKELYFSDKKGNVFYVGEEIELIYDGGNYVPEENFYEIPFHIDVSSDGSTLYFTDIGLRQVMGFRPDTGEIFAVYQRGEGLLDEEPLIYRLNYSDWTQEFLGFCSSEFNTMYVYNIDEQTLEESDSFVYPASVRMRYIALLVLFALLVLYVAKKLLQLLASILMKQSGDTMQTCIMVFVSMVLVFGITANYIIRDTTERYTDSVLQNMYSMARLTSYMVDGDLLEQLNTPDDYLNEAYMQVRDQLHSAYDKAYEAIYDFGDNTGNTTYCVFYRMLNNVVYYTMHLSDDSGVIYPDILTYEESDYKYIKDNDSAIIFSEISTDDGEWMYASVPVYNSDGEMVAVCEVGRDRVSYNQANQQLVLSLMIKIGALAVVVFFMITELVNLLGILKRRLELQQQQAKQDLMLVDFVRIFAFLMFMADNFTSVIIPIMSERMYDPSLPIPVEIATALPTSAQALATALTGFAFKSLIVRWGNRQSFRFGILLHVVGLTLCGLSGSLITFTLAMFVVGVGMGVNAICLNTYVSAYEGNEQVRGFALITTGTFAGTNCGIIIGTMLAEEFNYAILFFLSALLAAVLLVVVSVIYRKDLRLGEDAEEKEQKKISLSRFLWNRRILGYFIFAMAPYMIFASFVYYFMPIFAADGGISESNIGVITLLYGMLTAYLASASSKLIERFGSRLSIILACVMTVGALMIFVFNPTVQSMLLVVLIMGVADSFGYTALSAYFAGIDEVTQYGEENAYSISNVFDGAANTIAPYIFAVAMMIGIQRGMLLIGAGFLICAVLFAATSRVRRKK